MLNEQKKLLKNIEEGSQHAFNILFGQYQSVVYSIAFRIIKSHEIAEEIVFTVFLKIWQDDKLSRVDNIESYLRVLTRNQTLKSWRSLQLQTKRDLYIKSVIKSEDHTTEEQIAFNETAKLLKEAVEKLPMQQGLVYQLCHVEGKKYEEAAMALSLSKLTVKTHMQLALRFIRKYLKANTDVALTLLTIYYFLK
ncbi:RNA polymerase sigma factor [Pedobacter endophyticus]|uniref:Sigma-70 family RNA polymerase sigma factor n=1 Tax=Pedobacter endophyticus TaxID=2789740 RepID=A0A7U3SQ43_9SPHI|nr:sigma-70 family RNA polymerase sigma factor [Pedobacter endophyticus]QPH38706.1 sigma-70 family RNA polymerase sigma factor [Pedobacter endophyticus]